MDGTSNKYSVVLIYLALVLATLAAYCQMRHNDFVNFDDGSYVTENEHVKAGLTRDSIVWALGFTETSYWHPLTLFSHMLDCQLYGLRAGMHHLSSLILHIANALLLFAVLKRMTGALYSSAFAAALFALHPVNVDSVAWVAERKSILSTFFWLLTMAGYLRYVGRPGKGRYLLMLLVFALGLMAKPMLVTLPFVLLLLDYWPLGRLQLGRAANRRGRSFQWKPFYLLVLEKVPFFVLSAVSVWLSSLSLRRFIGCSVPIKLRIANALVCYVRYIEKMLWPRDLAVLYPYPNTLPAWQAIAAGLLLLVISILVIRSARNHKYLLTGWLWYLGTLVPVSGLMQRGLWPAMADRWAYVPLVGLFIIITWGLSDILAKWKYRKVILGASALIVLLALSICTRLQVRHWRNSVTLFEHAVEATDNNYLAYCNLGAALAKQDKIDEAVTHFSKALHIRPNFTDAHRNLGKAFLQQGRLEEAAGHYWEVLRTEPLDAEAHNDLGIVLGRQGRLDKAIAHFKEALRIKPDLADAHSNLGYALTRQGKSAQAVEYLQEAIRLNPDSAKAHYILARALADTGRAGEAITHLREALRLRPDWLGPMKELAWLLATHNQADFRNPEEAIRLAERACELTDYEKPGPLDILAAAYAAADKFPEAVATARKALELAEAAEQKELAEDIRDRLQLYKTGRPYFEKPSAEDKTATEINE